MANYLGHLSATRFKEDPAPPKQNFLDKIASAVGYANEGLKQGIELKENVNAINKPSEQQVAALDYAAGQAEQLLQLQGQEREAAFQIVKPQWEQIKGKPIVAYPDDEYLNRIVQAGSQYGNYGKNKAAADAETLNHQRELELANARYGNRGSRGKPSDDLSFQQQEEIKANYSVKKDKEMADYKRQNEQQDLATKNKKNYGSFSVALKSLDESLENTSTGTFVGMTPGVTDAQRISDGAIANMLPTMKNLFREAGEGTFATADQIALEAMIPTRQDSPSVRRQKVEQINKIVREKLGYEPMSFYESGNESGNDLGDGFTVEVRK